MTSKDNGGPAFPFVLDSADCMQKYETGMTLRDYFAAKAMVVVYGGLEKNDFAKSCYAIADAMLLERAK